MSKLPVISSNEFIRYLIKKKKFVYDRTNGSHHVYKKEDKLVTVPERKEIGKGLLKTMLKEAGIEREDFIQEWNN